MQQLEYSLQADTSNMYSKTELDSYHKHHIIESHYIAHDSLSIGIYRSILMTVKDLWRRHIGKASQHRSGMVWSSNQVTLV